MANNPQALGQEAMRRWLTRIFRDAAFPLRCRGCRRLYDPSPRLPGLAAGGGRAAEFAAWAADYFCADCARAQWTLSPLCPRCGLPYASRHGVDHLCSRCSRTPHSFDEARAVGIYRHSLQTLIQDLKYGGRAELAVPLGRLLWKAFADNWHPDEFDWILPVPLHWRRLMRRGFNQAEVLLGCWPRAAAETGIVFNPRRIARRMLIRRRATASQTGLGRRQRKANLREAFRLRDPDRVDGRRILIVDDVFTTGATADACALVLKRAGAAAVNVLTLVRAL